MPLNPSKPILYLITRGASTEATTPDAPEFAQILNQISAAAAAGIDLIQIREKQMTARVLFELAAEAAKLTRGTNTRLLVNDRADIASAACADGVHLTTQSLDAAIVRKTFGDNFLIGASTHSLPEATSARDHGADFAVFGPVFETKSKLQFGSPMGLDKLSRVARELRGFPVLALGGVTIANAANCLDVGASGIAGISLFDKPENFSKLLAAVNAAGGKTVT
jgi:thiamine-phosphate pyrophosphorylase